MNEVTNIDMNIQYGEITSLFVNWAQEVMRK